MSVQRSSGSVSPNPSSRALAAALVALAAAAGARAEGDLSGMLLSPEIVWGGTGSNPQATGSPFPDSSQAVATPAVGDLDGDGIPELVFPTYCGTGFTSNGVLRAIHGGGTSPGSDYFALCGATLWQEGDDPNAVSCACSAADLDPGASVAIADLDRDGDPEIVALTEGDDVRILDHTGAIVSTHPTSWPYQQPQPSVADVDGQGLPEIIVGNHVFALEVDGGGVLGVRDQFVAPGSIPHGFAGKHACAADLDGDGRLEIAVGLRLYQLPNPPPGVTRRSECSGAETDPEELAFCNGELQLLWNAASVNGLANDDGACAIADVLGADTASAPGPANPPDGVAEVLVAADGKLFVLAAADGTLLAQRSAAQSSTRGGPPTVADFDGDGFPEIGTAFASSYDLFDLQDTAAACPAWPNLPADDSTPLGAVNVPRTPPGGACTQDSDCSAAAPGTACHEPSGECICLHNGWARRVEDNSSQMTGSSAFDLNGDAVAEVLYSDECRFRIYDGRDGLVHFSELSESRTLAEYPLAADVDRDGRVEVVFVTANESGFCSERASLPPGFLNNGVEVWGDVADVVVSGRGVWNQHGYHVSNVSGDAGIPPREPPGWARFQGAAPLGSYRAGVPAPRVALFKDPAYSDAEADHLESQLATLGYTAEPFSGTGAAAWSGALAAADALVIPRPATGVLVEDLDAGAVSALESFVGGGGALVLHRGFVAATPAAGNLLNGVFGFSVVEGGAGGASALDAVAAAGTAFAAGPAALPEAGDIDHLEGTSLPAGSRAVYGFGADDHSVALLPYGDGQIAYLGLDWAAGHDADWHEVLGLALRQLTTLPEPSGPAALAAGAALLVALGARRRPKVMSRSN